MNEIVIKYLKPLKTEIIEYEQPAYNGNDRQKTHTLISTKPTTQGFCIWIKEIDDFGNPVLDGITNYDENGSPLKQQEQGFAILHIAVSSVEAYLNWLNQNIESILINGKDFYINPSITQQENELINAIQDDINGF